MSRPLKYALIAYGLIIIGWDSAVMWIDNRWSR